MNSFIQAEISFSGQKKSFVQMFLPSSIHVSQAPACFTHIYVANPIRSADVYLK